MATKEEKLQLCQGCSENYYNGNNDRDIQECWHLETAQVVKRWRIGWHVHPTSPDCFQKVTTLNCHRNSGVYLDQERLPDHLGGIPA